MKKVAYRGSRGHILGCAALVASVASYNQAHAVELDVGPDWAVRLDNTITYNLGVRVQDVDDKIGNNPVFAQSDYSYERGDIVTNRISNLMELDAQNVNGWGARISASMFKDFAFNDSVSTNPGQLAPGTPYSALGSYDNNRYSSYTKRYYKEGVELLDAFAYSSFDLGGHESSLMAGRFTKFWGNAVFFGALGINYSQNAADNIKASFAPGTEAKELAIPREQIYFSTQLTPELVAEAQFFLKFKGNLLPEGGTYLSVADFLSRGPDGSNLTAAFGLGQRGSDVEPEDINDNFGLKLSWAPSALRGAVSAYYRQLDETQPWMPMLQYDSNTFAVQNYHLAHAQKVQLFGLSLEKQVGEYSLGVELSHRRDTGLNSSSFNPNDALGREGARGNVTNVLVNVLSGLARSPFWDTGTLLGELGYTRLNSVTKNAEMFNGVDNPSACPTQDKWMGCSTKDAWMVAGLFKPQWLGVWPSVDLAMPMFAMYGLKGNASSLGVPMRQGSAVYTIGLEAKVQQKYTVTLQYNGYYARPSGTTNAGAALGVPNGTDGFPTFYEGGNGTFMYNDKGWLSLTAKASF
ncbi:MAG: DUF1302 family protein [Pseudomonas sp.]|uniref:DUF1302 domain-containing protein n=1 Tax=Pseudomonas sp. TaxID=306 RepID=UPI003981FF28